LGETRTLFKLAGKADGPTLRGGDLETSVNISAVSEFARYRGEAVENDKYIKENFKSGRKNDRTVAGGFDLVLLKRTEVSLSGSSFGDTVSASSGGRLAIGQWFFGDQLRFGVQGQKIIQKRPEQSFLDTDGVTVNLGSRVITDVGGVSIKAIMNPTTIVTADYNRVVSTNRPVLHAYAGGIRQFFPGCECAVHGEAARVINLGQISTNTSNGELVGTQFSIAYLQSLPGNVNGRLGYRYAREDEYKRAYADHLVFGADSYSAAVSKEMTGGLVGGAIKSLTADLAVNRYIQNDAGSATTMELGAAVKF
jgi:hypothetical protein